MKNTLFFDDKIINGSTKLERYYWLLYDVSRQPLVYKNIILLQYTIQVKTNCFRNIYFLKNVCLQTSNDCFDTLVENYFMIKLYGKCLKIPIFCPIQISNTNNEIFTLHQNYGIKTSHLACNLNKYEIEVFIILRF